MYILVRESIPLGFAINAVGHASLACFLKYASNRDMQQWLANSFKKVTCKVTDEELAVAMKEDNHIIITESAIACEVVAVAFCPRKEWPESFSKFRLYRNA